MSEITYTLDRSAKRKHTYITVTKEGEVLVRTSLFTPRKRIEAFIASKSAWIEQTRAKILDVQQRRTQYYYFLGEKKERCDLDEKALEAYYRKKAKEIIPPLVEQYAEQMQLFPTKVSFRKNKSRWGSCSARDRLTFNIFLMRTPIEFIEYVVVHELAHIMHKNHSQDFWKLVESYLPDYKTRRKIGKEIAYTL